MMSPPRPWGFDEDGGHLIDGERAPSEKEIDIRWGERVDEGLDLRPDIQISTDEIRNIVEVRRIYNTDSVEDIAENLFGIARKAPALRTGLRDGDRLCLVLALVADDIHAQEAALRFPLKSNQPSDRQIISRAVKFLRRPGAYDRVVVWIVSGAECVVHGSGVSKNGRRTVRVSELASFLSLRNPVELVRVDDSIREVISNDHMRRESPNRHDLPFLNLEDINSGRVLERHMGADSNRRSSERSRHYLLVADEWFSRRGGISSFNRELALQLRRAGYEVTVAMPEKPDTDELQQMSEAGIKYAIPPEDIVGIDGMSPLLLGVLGQDGREIDPNVIVGHGRILGPFALALKMMRFPKAKLVHVVHTEASALELAKELNDGVDRSRDASRRSEIERSLVWAADVVTGVGPRLSAAANDYLISCEFAKEKKTIDFIPGLSSSWDADANLGYPRMPRILMTARVEDFSSKGVDVAVRAIGRLRKSGFKDFFGIPYLRLQGVSENDSNVRDRIEESCAGASRWVERGLYSSDFKKVYTEVAESFAVVMPSATEGFGLSAYEAIALGKPVVISRESGLAELLRNMHNGEYPAEVVSSDDEQGWAEAIERLLKDPESAYSRALVLRDRIRSMQYWKNSIDELNQALDELSD